MKLHLAPGACSLAVHIALREVGVWFEAVSVDLARHVTADGTGYFNISPRGHVPLLELDDVSRQTEAGSLLQYVADLDPAQSLIGAYVFTIINWARFLALSLTRYPHLQAHRKRESERPRVQDALRAEGLLK